MNKTVKIAILAGSILAVAAPASAAITVLGTSRAASCYEAAERHVPTRVNINTCLAALDEDALTSRERVATNVNLGILYFFNRDYDTALARFDQALTLDPDEPEAVLNKAITYLRRDEDGSTALPLFSQAIDMGTREPALAYFGRGLAHEMEGDLTAAYLDIRRAAELEPDWTLPEQNLARFIVERR